jgi:hypothetical protein
MKHFIKALLIVIFFSCNKHEFPLAPYPRLETLTVEKLDQSVMFRAAIIQEAGSILNHGFVWGESSTITIFSGNKVELGASSSLNNFKSSQSGFVKGKVYYVKSFVSTEDYFVYGNAVGFTW